MRFTLTGFYFKQVEVTPPSYQQQTPLQTRSRHRVTEPTPRTWYHVRRAYSPRRRYRARRGARVNGSRRLGAGSRVRSGARSAGARAC